MSLETILLWIAIGLIAGWLASALVGGGYGVIGDIVVGVVGAFLGGLIFRGLHIGVPFGGLRRLHRRCRAAAGAAPGPPDRTLSTRAGGTSAERPLRALGALRAPGLTLTSVPGTGQDPDREHDAKEK